MVGPSVMVVRETASLADSVQLLLETVGFRVVPEEGVPEALERLADTRREPIRAVVVACNQARSEMLGAFPESFPSSARKLPLVVVGDRPSLARRGWPSNILFVGLPFETRRFLELLHDRMDLAATPPAVVGAEH